MRYPWSWVSKFGGSLRILPNLWRGIQFQDFVTGGLEDRSHTRGQGAVDQVGVDVLKRGSKLGLAVIEEGGHVEVGGRTPKNCVKKIVVMLHFSRGW